MKPKPGDYDYTYRKLMDEENKNFNLSVDTRIRCTKLMCVLGALIILAGLI